MLNINKNLSVINYNAGNISRVKYIAVHYTANNGDTAYNNTVYFKSAYRGASANLFVDETSIWQSVDDKNIAWHIGTSGKYYHAYARNSNTIGIEMCSRIGSDGKYYIPETTQKNTAELVKYLMNKYNIPIANVLRHYDVTHKSCPEPFVRVPSQWTNFKALITGATTSTVTSGSSTTASAGTTYIKNNRVGLVQTALNTSYKSNLIIDKSCGPATQKAITAHNLAYYGGVQPYGAYVKAMQQMLNDLGYNCGNADGYFGKKTKAAALAYQKANGLSADGIVGLNTMLSMLKKFN